MNRRDTPIKGLLIDVDGVLRVGDRPLPGAVETIRRLRAETVPFRLLTNTTTRSRTSLGRDLRGMGFDIADDAIITAPVATARYLRRRFPGASCYLIAKGDVAEDLEGVALSDGPEARVVVVAGAEENFTYDALNHAFQLLLDGAALVAMHRNRYWMTPEGPKLDAGAFIRGLEYATGKRAVVVGKPAAAFFRAGVDALGLPVQQVAMIGDDLLSDVLPAMRLGCHGVLVRTGKFRPSDLEAGQPDAMLDSIAELPDWLEGCGRDA